MIYIRQIHSLADVAYTEGERQICQKIYIRTVCVLPIVNNHEIRSLVCLEWTLTIIVTRYYPRKRTYKLRRAVNKLL